MSSFFLSNKRLLLYQERNLFYKESKLRLDFQTLKLFFKKFYFQNLMFRFTQYSNSLQMSSKTTGKPLTLQLVFNKTKSDNLNNIKNLNLWGNQLQDLQLIDKMPNLEVISLSVNKINSLKDFAKCSKLHELYLRKNCITDLRQIRYLLDLPYLKSLWLYDNPCAQHENYRQIVLHYLPNLTKLDNNVVTSEQKAAAASPKYDLDFSSLAQQKQSYVQEPAKKSDINQSEVKRVRPYSEIHRQERPSNEYGYRGGSNKQISHPNQNEPNMENLTRNKNILIAVLSLLKQLDSGSLEIVRKEAEKQLRSR